MPDVYADLLSRIPDHPADNVRLLALFELYNGKLFHALSAYEDVSNFFLFQVSSASAAVKKFLSMFPDIKRGKDVSKLVEDWFERGAMARTRQGFVIRKDKIESTDSESSKVISKNKPGGL